MSDWETIQFAILVVFANIHTEFHTLEQRLEKITAAQVCLDKGFMRLWALRFCRIRLISKILLIAKALFVAQGITHGLFGELDSTQG